MGYLGQKYDKGIVIQRSEEGSAFQEDVEVTVEGEQELTPKVGGGFKKVTVYGAGGSEVIPNPEMEGDEPDLTGIEIDGDKYKIPEGTAVEANPELSGGESNLSGLQIGDTKYVVPQGTNVVANPTMSGSEPKLTGLQVGDNKYKVPQGGGTIVNGINIDVIYGVGAVTITRLTATPQPFNSIMEPSDLYDYFNSLYNDIKENYQGGYVYDSSTGASVEADLSKGMYQGISGTYNEHDEIYGIVACVSTNEYGDSRRELGAVYFDGGYYFDSSFVIVEDGKVEQSVSSILQKSIGRE